MALKKKAVFNSSSQQDGPPGYRERSGEEVKILNRIKENIDEEDVGPMFRIQFADGVETDAFADELD